MKKIKFLLTIFITVIFLTGCDSNDGKEILDEALANMSNIKSASVIREIEMGADGYSVTMTVSGDFDSDTGYGHYNTKISVSGYAMTSESYSIEKDNELYTYTTNDGETWSYIVEDANLASSDMSNLNLATQYAGKYKSVKKVKSDIDGMTKLELVISKETMNELMNKSEETSSIDILKDLTMFVYVKDGYINLMYLDLSDVMNTDATAGFTKVSMTITMNNHNSIDEITIPDEVIKNAVLAIDEE